MNDQTPSTEDVLDAVVEYASALEDAAHPLSLTKPISLDGVRTALAARDREVAAKALREAASRIGGDRGPRGGVRMADEVEWAQWLNARADRIGAGDE